MSNSGHLVNYKPGLTMDEPVSVTMAAADWAILMAWFVNAEDTDGINHIVYGVIARQVTEALYTPASVQAARAHHADQEPQIVQTLREMGVPVATFPNAEDFEQPTIFTNAGEVWVIECAECNSRDEYPPRFTGRLTCGHDGMRSVREIRLKEDE